MIPNVFMASSIGNFLINLMINVCLLLDHNAFSDYDSGALVSWSDPTDGREAMYIQAPADACLVYFDADTGVIEIDFSDACDERQDQTGATASPDGHA